VNIAPDTAAVLDALNTLAGGLFLLTAYGIVATRQARGCLLLFIVQSVLLAASALLLGARYQAGHLYAVGIINLVAKPVVIPWILRRTIYEEIYTRREIDQVLNIPTSLTIALVLVVLAYFLTLPLERALAPEFRGANLPIGFAVLFLGAFTLTVRREAVPLLIGLLAMENGAFFAGIGVSRELPFLVELAIASDGLIMVFVLGVLTRAIQQRVGSTRVGALATLKEEASR